MSREERNGQVLFYLIAAVFLAVSFLCTGCGKEELPVVSISLWTDERQEELLRSAMEMFAEQHKDEIVLDYQISIEREDTCKETVLSNPEGAADIFIFADDQLDDMVRSGVLLEITEDREEILSAVGGEGSGAAQAVLRDDRMYAYPVSAGNGYFLYYNKAYFSEEDIRSLDRILEVAEENGKKFTMDFSSGWYIYSFFKGAGLTLNTDESGLQNICNWNATDTTYTGVDVAEAMSRIAQNEGFISLQDDGFLEGVRDGSVIAGVNGAWNAENVQQAWGDDYAAAMLPTYTLDGKQVQMYSFMGYKLMGINANTANPEWCMEIAEYLTSGTIQLLRFKTVGESPANIAVAADETVQSAPAVAALSAQSAYSCRQNVAEPFWHASSIFGITIAGGNLGETDLQELLDIMVEGVTAPAE